MMTENNNDYYYKVDYDLSYLSTAITSVIVVECIQLLEIDIVVTEGGMQMTLITVIPTYVGRSGSSSSSRFLQCH